jgi:arylsulfatase A-like enzyme
VVLLLLLATACTSTKVVDLSHPSDDRTTPSFPTASPPLNRPNILVIETDDMRVDDLRWMPNVRHFIQDRGLTFENSFAPYPLCCPSRSSFLTGEYAHNHGVLSHVAPWGFHAFRDKTTLATQLQAGGYETALIGKYLNGYGEQPIHGTRDHSSLLYVPPGWSQWHAGSDHLWAPGELYDGHPMGGGTYAYFNLTQNINGRLANFNGQYNTDVLSRQADHVIEDFGREKRPWFVWFTPIAPHFGSPVEPDDPKPLAMSNGVVEDWFTPARPDWVKGHFNSVITHGLGVPLHHSAEADVSDKPRWIRKLPELSPQEKVNETILTRQRAEALFVLDHDLAKTFAILKRTGQWDNTILAFTSDNGYYLGEHRKREGKIELHEPDLRVPFLIAGPGIPHGRRYDPISTVDMAPTFLDLADVPQMPREDGVSMVRTIEHGDQGWIWPVVTEAMMGGLGHGTTAVERDDLGFTTALNTRGIRLGRWKLTEYATGESELYDLQTDPMELQSLSHDPRYASIYAQMRALWLEYKDCAGAACWKPLPAKWQLTPAQEKAITDNEIVKTAAYFNNPPVF